LNGYGYFLKIKIARLGAG